MSEATSGRELVRIGSEHGSQAAELPSPTPPNPSRSVHFYQDTAIFQVENTLYKVPKIKLEEGSSVFRSMFSLPQRQGGAGEDKSSEGQTDENPIVLSYVSKRDFHQLLETLYPPKLHPRPRSRVEWIALLNVATTYSFQEIRTHAIQNLNGFLSEMSDLEMVQLAREYGVSDWFLRGLTQLVMRQTSLTEEECEKLEPATCSRVHQMREKCRERGHRNSSSGCRAEYKSVHEEELRKAFSEELDNIAWHNAQDAEPE